MRLRLALPLALVTGAAVIAACAPPGPRPASPVDLDRFRVQRGALVSAETTFTGMHGRYAAYRLRLTSGTGLTATGRLLSPGRGVDGAPSRRLPAVLLNDGRELDSRAVEYLPPEFGDLVVLSLDYPDALPYEIDLTDVLLHGQRLREAAEQVPALFSLGAAYLAGRADVDSARIALAATSFAVPFAVVAAAADARFQNVALIYGAGDLDRVLAANLTLRPRFLRSLAAWIATRPFRSLEPERYVARIAPRPLVMVNGRDDPQIPRSAVMALYAAAREPKSLVWLPTGHLMPTDTSLIRALVDTALSRLPILRGIERPGAAADTSADAGAVSRGDTRGDRQGSARAARRKRCDETAGTAGARTGAARRWRADCSSMPVIPA